MKKLFYVTLALAGITCQSSLAQKPVFQEHISKNIPVPKGSFLGVYNMNGTVEVQGYGGSEVKFEIDQKITGDNQNGLAEGKEEFELKFDQSDDKLYVYLESPWSTAPREIRPDKGQWRNQEKEPYQVDLHFIIKVPNSLTLHVSTVNHGQIKIEDFEGLIEAYNVNGSIEIDDAHEVAKAKSVNGAVTVNFSKSPSIASEIKTVNGKITLTYPPDLNGEFSLKTLNGDYYTNFDYTSASTGVSKVIDGGGSMKKYKISQSTRIKIGEGGQQHATETLNGSIYIKKNI